MYAIVSQEILVDRAVHAAAYRFLLPSNASHNSLKRTLLMEDFSKAMHGFLPVAMRDLRKYAPDDKDGGWEDVGGLNEAVTIIKEVHIFLLSCLKGVGFINTLMEKKLNIFKGVDVPTYICVPSCRLLNCHQNTQISLPRHLCGCGQTFSCMDHLDVVKLTL